MFGTTLYYYKYNLLLCLPVIIWKTALPHVYDGDDTEHGHKDIWILATGQSFSMYVHDIHIFYVPSSPVDKLTEVY